MAADKTWNNLTQRRKVRKPVTHHEGVHEDREEKNFRATPQTRSEDRKLTKSEIRISKSETTDETNKMRNIKLSKHSRVLVSNFARLVIKICFEFRILRLRSGKVSSFEFEIIWQRT